MRWSDEDIDAANAAAARADKRERQTRLERLTLLVDQVRSELSAYDLGHDGVFAANCALDSLLEKAKND